MAVRKLEEWGWLLTDLERFDLLNSVGAAIWTRWESDIRQGKHPPPSELLAFARAWVVPLLAQAHPTLATAWVIPVGGWCSRVVAHLADRLDPAVKTPSGRRRLSSSAKLDRYHRELEIAQAVYIAWRRNKQARIPRPQQAAFERVATRFGVGVPKARVAFARHRRAVEVLAKLVGAKSDAKRRARMDSLSDPEVEAVAGPEDLAGLILSAFTSDELHRLSWGEDLESVLASPSDFPTD